MTTDYQPRETRSLDFGNLPLVEVALRVSLQSQLPITFGLIDELGVEMRSHFPRKSELIRFEVAPGAPTDFVRFSPGFIPGVAFENQETGESISLQRNVVVARWTKQANGAEYSGYNSLRDALKRVILALSKSAKEDTLRISVVNMSYVNFIVSSGDDDKLMAYFAKESQVTLVQSATAVHKIEASWREGDGKDLRYSIELGKSQDSDRELDGHLLTTVAGQALADGPDPFGVLDDLHARLQDFFMSLISDYAKQLWQLRSPQHD